MLQEAHCTSTCECSERSLLYSMSLLQASESSVGIAIGQQELARLLCQQHLTVVPNQTIA